MILFKMERGLWYIKPFLVLVVILLFLDVTRAMDEEFSCHTSAKGLLFKGEQKGGGKTKTKNKDLRPCKGRRCAAIIPRGNIYVKAGDNGTAERVLCRFNSTLVNKENVYFATKQRGKEDGILVSTILNDTTIETWITHKEPAKYQLQCKMKRTNRTDKKLCDQIVKAGYEPLDIVELQCLSHDYIDLNCTWKLPDNPIDTIYERPTYVNPNFFKEQNCSKGKDPSPTYCYWKDRAILRDRIELRINASNRLGRKNFTHHIFPAERVLPNKIPAFVTLLRPNRVRVDWKLTWPMDVFYYGVYHNVQYRLANTEQWQNVTHFFHKNPITKLEPKRNQTVQLDLPYANVFYEFRVRIHSGFEGRKETLWSPYDIITIKSDPLVPSVAPKTSKSTFEIIEGLDERDIYVYFQDLDILDYAGENFRYTVKVYFKNDPTPLPLEATDVNQAYFMYKSRDYNKYRFEIFPTNDEGVSTVSSEVVVPPSDCLPKKTSMFTVISRTTEEGRLYSLYWIDSYEANKVCSEASTKKIDSYTIFWCKKTNGDRCRTRLYWREVTNLEMLIKEIPEMSGSQSILFEKNITDLDQNELYNFGVAANSGQYSSGIRWASCIVDQAEPPLAPITNAFYKTGESSSAIVKWELKCASISAVPIGFNVSYCKSDIPDFGHCESEVKFQVVNSARASNMTIHQLHAGVSYIFSVSVLSLIGEGRQSVPKLVKMGDEMPTGPPTNIEIKSFSNDTVSLSWNPPSFLNRKGRILEYRIETDPVTKIISIDTEKLDESITNFKYIVHGLLPYTSYEIKVLACTIAGCAYRTPGIVAVKTKSSAPKEVKDFEIDVANWRLAWERTRCTSVECSLDVIIRLNETEKFNFSLIDGEDKYDLKELECNSTRLQFSARERGLDEFDNILYGPWTTIDKEADVCPPVGLLWWVYFIITILGFLIAIVLIFIARHGYGNIRQTIKDCYQSISLPKGIQTVDSNKDHHHIRKEYPPDPLMVRIRTSEPSLLLLHPENSPVNIGFQSRGIITNRDSVSSEEVNLIDAVEADRHGRNLSGSSDHSSAQDSALVSVGGDTDPEMSNDLTETMLRQRNPAGMPAYVQHGMVMLEKLSEGYVTAHSVPSLPHLYKDGGNENQHSTPNLNGEIQNTGWQNARRASTGYISMPDSEAGGAESPQRKEDNFMGGSRVPQMTRIPGMPSYSRHSFSPKLDGGGSKPSTPPGAQVGYVTITDSRFNRSPSPPSSATRQNDASVGYVSAADPLRSLKRPPSLPLIPKNTPLGEDYLPVGAYCKVGSRENSANKGYVSVGPNDNGMPPRSSTNPYVTYGEAAVMSANRIPSHVSSNPPPPYVELTDAGRWAHPRSPTLSSAPLENGGMRIGGGNDLTTRVGSMPRPNTTEATIGHHAPHHQGTGGSLSKQSSGYVSQETIHPCGVGDGAVVMSPKRLLSQAAVPHSVLMSPSHQASMV